jgi:hypothetical protein
MNLQSFPLIIRSWFLSYKRFIAPITWYSVGTLLVCCTGVLVSCVSADGIVDYKPSEFTGQASEPFFFSIGKKLKYGTAISEEVPTLLEGKLFDGELRAVYPSPDQTKAAVVTGGKLYFVEPGKPPLILLDPFVSWLEGRKIPIGETYYDFGHIQWDATSRYIFLTRDKIQERPINPESFRQRNNMNRALVRIDTTQDHSIVEVIPAGQFRTTSGPSFINDDGICFDSSDNKGDVYLKCIVAGNAHIAKKVETDKIVFNDGLVLNGRIFMTSRLDYISGDILMVESGFHLTKREGSLVVDLLHKNKPDSPMLSVEGAINIKGHFWDGIHERTILPGGRYAFLHVWHKKILLDSETGSYKELPTNTRVYQNVNSRDHESSFQLKHTFFMRTFEPTSPLRTNYSR